ncbi:MAG: hypothetical protein FWH59_03165, partial [Lentimicrobiaceae bacterium]|nr:hypothetical protein [Lentimicrobiaceae bacterium]
MKKTFLLTICLLIVSFTSFAGKLAMIPVSETQNLETLFADHNLKIHYYCDDYVLATAESLSYDNAVVLDEHAFKEVDSYAIVYCYNDYKEEYLAKIDGSVETLYSGEHFFIMKLIGDGFMPAKNDGTVVIRDREAQLCKSTFDYPIVTEPDENILNLISQVSTDSLIAVVQHLQDYVTRDCQHTNI